MEIMLSFIFGIGHYNTIFDYLDIQSLKFIIKISKDNQRRCLTRPRLIFLP